MNKMNKYMIFLEKNKSLVGLHQWHIILAENVEMEDSFAEAEHNLQEKIIKIALSKECSKFTPNKVKSILMHELLHVRFNIFEKEKELLNNSLEEEYINDLERGYMFLMNINTQKESIKNEIFDK